MYWNMVYQWSRSWPSQNNYKSNYCGCLLELTWLEAIKEISGRLFSLKFLFIIYWFYWVLQYVRGPLLLNKILYGILRCSGQSSCLQRKMTSVTAFLASKPFWCLFLQLSFPLNEHIFLPCKISHLLSPFLALHLILCLKVWAMTAELWTFLQF